MNIFPIAFLKKIISGGATMVHVSFDKERMLALGALALVAAFGTLMLWDGYLFYRAVTDKKLSAPRLVQKEISLNRTLDEALAILEERAKKFEEKIENNKRE